MPQVRTCSKCGKSRFWSTYGLIQQSLRDAPWASAVRTVVLRTTDIQRMSEGGRASARAVRSAVRNVQTYKKVPIKIATAIPTEITTSRVPTAI